MYMKKILNEFLKREKNTILKTYVWDFTKFVKENFVDIDVKEAEAFFWNMQKLKKENDKKYEEQHIRKTIRFSKNEFFQIEEQLEKADIKNFSQWAKSVLLKKKIRFPIEQERIIQLTKIGTNLNQIAKKINTAENIDQALVVNTLKKLIALEQEVKEIK